MNQVEMNQQAKLSEHFSLGELTRSKSHPDIYNVPSHVHIENLKRVCVWLEALRERYNLRYVLSEKSPTGARPQGAVSVPGDAGGQVLRGAGGQVPKSRLAKAGGQVPKVGGAGPEKSTGEGWGSGPESRSFRGKLYFETRPRGYFETRPRKGETRPRTDHYNERVSVGGAEPEGGGSGDLEPSDGLRGGYSRGGEGATDSLCVYPARLFGRDEAGLRRNPA